MILKSGAEGPLSVLLVCHSYPPVIGGSEIEAQRVCKALIARGHRVQVVCAGGPPMPPLRDWIDPEGVPVRMYGERWTGALKDMIFALRVAGMLISKRHDYQVVYFLMQGLHLALGLPVAKALRKPIVMKISGSGVVPFMAGTATGRLELAWLRRWARYVMVLNDGMRQEAIDHGLSSDQLLWMPNPVDTDEFAPASEAHRRILRSDLDVPTGAPVVLYCGRLAPEKQLPSLLEAFAIVVRRLPEARLVLVGDGPARGELESLVSRLNLQSNTRFVGSVRPQQVSSWMKIADIFALVSINEGFPCAVSEAMSAGVACVVSDIPANRQLIKEAKQGLLAPVGNSDAIAAAVLRLLADAPLRAEMGRAGRKCILDNYSTNRIADRYEDLFHATLVHPGAIGNQERPLTSVDDLQSFKLMR